MQGRKRKRSKQQRISSPPGNQSLTPESNTAKHLASCFHIPMSCENRAPKINVKILGPQVLKISTHWGPTARKNSNDIIT